MRYLLPRLTVLTGFAALACVVTSAAFAAIPPPPPTQFGPSGSNVDSGCARKASIYSTSSQQGCLERVVTGPARLRVVVRAAPPLNYRIRLLACTSAFNSCTAAVATLVRQELPPAGSPARTMTRFTYSVDRAALAQSALRICARQDALLSIGGPSQAALLGCQPFATEYAGEFQATVTKEGVVVDGWIINPRSREAVKVLLRRTAKPALFPRGAARLPDARSKERFPDFPASHGFRFVLPFLGRGGTFEVCLATPGRAFPVGGKVVACLDYVEAASVFTDKSNYAAGEPVSFNAEMLDAGARIRLNLYTSVGTFLIPWKNADIGNLTANDRGHAAGQFSTRSVPPGSYRLAMQCLSGCSVIARKFGPTTSGGVISCCESAPGILSPVTLGPSLNVRSRSRASAELRVLSHTKLRVKATGLPSNATVEPVVVIGGFPRSGGFQPHYVDGSPLLRLDDAQVDANGRLTRDLQLPLPLDPWTYLLWLVDDAGTVLTSTQFIVPATIPGGLAVKFYPPTHGLNLTGGLPTTLPPDVLSQIAGSFAQGTGNYGTDLLMWTPHLHFDNAALPGAVCQQANQVWNEFAGMVRASTAVGDWPKARGAFGRLTHAAQDFYTHSNWLELGQRTIAPLFPVCTGVGLPGALQTGYFHLNFKSLITGCPIVNGRPSPPVPFNECHETLNKDSATSGRGARVLPEGGRRYHQAAVDLATEATRDLYGKIRTFVGTQFTPQLDDLSGPCLADALFGLLPVRSGELAYCRDLTGTWTSTGTTTAPVGTGAGTWTLTQTGLAASAHIEGSRNIETPTCPSSGRFTLDAAPIPGPNPVYTGTYPYCYVNEQTGAPATGLCSGVHFAPIVLTYRGEGRLDVALTFTSAVESSTQCRETGRVTNRFELRR